MTNPLDDFLVEYKTNKGDPYTHTNMGGLYGCFDIPLDQKSKLIDLVHNKVFEKNEKCYLTEKPPQHTIVKADLDFKYPFDETERKYNVNHIKDIITLYHNATKHYIDVPLADLRAFVFERDQPYKNKGNFKDGIHIMYPNIICDTTIQHLIREHVLSNCQPVLTELKCKNNFEDIIDKSIISTNNWLMYGCSKPVAKPYKLTHIYDHQCNDLDIKKYNNKQLIELLSIRDHDINQSMPIKTKHLHLLQKKPVLTKKIIMKLPIPITFKNQTSYVEKLLTIIKPKNNYNDWLHIGMAIYNEKCPIEIWINHSRLCSNFDEKECQFRWNTFKDNIQNGYTIGTLHKFAKNDNLEEYNKLLKIITTEREKLKFMGINHLVNDNDEIYQETLDNEDHIALGKNYLNDDTDALADDVINHNENKQVNYNKVNPLNISNKLLQAFLKSQTSVANFFTKHNRNDIKVTITNHIYIWNQPNRYWKPIDDDGLIDVIANFFLKILEPMVIEAKKLARQENTAKKEGDEDGKHTKSLKIITKALKSMASVAYSSSIKKLVKHQLKDEKFYDLIDSDKDIINLKNKVINLRTGTIRERLRNDYATMILNDDYLPPNQKIIDEIKEILLKINNCDNNLLESMLKWLGYCLTGHNTAKKFLTIVGHSADNGKSTMSRIHETCLPIYSKSIDNRTFSANYEKHHKVFANIGKPFRYVYIEELNKSKLDVDRIKGMIDSPMIEIEELYGTVMKIYLQCKLTFLSNHEPDGGSDSGYNTRGLRTELTNQFLEKNKYEQEYQLSPTTVFLADKNILDNFRNKHEYRLAYINLLLPYAKLFYTENGLTVDIQLSINFCEATAEKDTMAIFIDQVFDHTSDPNHKIHKDDFTALYNKYLKTTYPISWAKILSDVKRLKLNYHKDWSDKGKRGVLSGLLIKPVYIQINGNQLTDDE